MIEHLLTEARGRKERIDAARAAIGALDRADRLQLLLEIVDGIGDTTPRDPLQLASGSVESLEVPLVEAPRKAPAPERPAIPERMPARRARRYDGAERDRILARIRQGGSDREVGEDLGLNENTVGYIRRTAGIPASGKPGPRRPRATATRPTSDGDDEEAEVTSAPQPPVARPARRRRSEDGPTDSNEIWRRTIGQHRLLTGAEERELASRLAAVEIKTWEIVLESPHAARTIALVTATLAAEGAVMPRTANPKSLRALDLDRRLITDISYDLSDAAAAIPEDPNDAEEIAKLAALKIAAAAVLESCREAEAIRELFIGCNLRLVASVAAKYKHTELPITDLIQEGNLGLMHAVPRFEAGRGCRFSTFAVWWIRHAIGRAIANQGRIVRVPVNMQDRTSKLRRRSHVLAGKLGRAPTEHELAEDAKITDKQTHRALDGYTLTGAPMGFDEPVSEDGSTLSELLADHRIRPADEVLADHRAKAHLEALLPELDPRLADVLRMRFGLGDTDEMTLKEIGKIYGLSRERIRQYEQTALQHLRERIRRSESPTA